MPVMPNKQSRPSRWLLRGESTIASTGLLLAAIVLCAMGGSAWWSARSHRATVRDARQHEVESIGELLSELSARLLSVNEVSTVRLLVAETARRHDLPLCRIVLPDGAIVVASNAADITRASLPETWTNEPVPAHVAPPSASDVSLSYPIDIQGRGAARMDIGAAVALPSWSHWETQAGIGMIAAGALFALLLVYRRMRSRMRAISFIRESLMLLDNGETALAALTVQSDLGSEANAWNELLLERERLQQVLVTKRLLELPAARNERSRDLTNMCDAMSQGLILVDSSLLTTYANGAAALYLGTSREKLLGAKIDEMLTVEQIAEAVRGVASGAIRRSTSVEVEQSGHDTDGVLRYSVRPVRHDDESAAMIVIEDVTQQRVANEARNSFVANVTHELRTPLTNILLYAETAMEDGDTDAHTRAKCLNVINQEAKRLDRIVGDMLSVAELEAGTHEAHIDDLDLAVLMEELELDYDAAAREKDITLRFDLPPKLPVIQADRDKIALALHNLVGNALKYTPTGGNVAVNVNCDDGLSISVVDDGIGMRDDDVDKIFEKFYRAKDERIAGITGSGLGLALAREVVRLHGGDITVESAVDEGSTFTLTVPACALAA